MADAGDLGAGGVSASPFSCNKATQDNAAASRSTCTAHPETRSKRQRWRDAGVMTAPDASAPSGRAAALVDFEMNVGRGTLDNGAPFVLLEVHLDGQVEPLLLGFPPDTARSLGRRLRSEAGRARRGGRS